MISIQSRHLALAFALGTFLYFVYLLTFSGIYTTNDEEKLIDTTAGFAVRSGPDRVLLNQSFYMQGLTTTDVEPAQPLLAAPLYWVGYNLDWVGTLHVLYLFNLMITALTAVVVFYYALHLGYDEKLALSAALLFGLTTIVWPYARTFFREPLTMLTLIATAYFVHRWRDAFTHPTRRATWLWGALAVIMAIFATLTKEAALIALPILIIFNVPDWSTLANRKHEIIGVGITLLVITVIVVGGLLLYREQAGVLIERYDLLTRLNTFVSGLSSAWYATLGYLFSPARGVFWYSPVLLLAVVAPLVLPRSKWREAWLPLMMLLVFAFVYAAVRGDQWFGGKSWGGRYMVPIVPLLMVGTLPMLERVIRSRSIAAKTILVILIALGFAVQLGAIIVPIEAFFTYQAEQVGHAPWSDTIVWSIQWSQAIGALIYLPIYLQAHNPDFLWWIPELDPVSIATIAGGGLLAGISVAVIRKYQHNWHIALAGLASVVLMSGLSLIVLARAYDDPRYAATDEGLILLREMLAQEAAPEDVIMLATPKYMPHFLNYYKGDALWYPLPVSPGERSSCEQAPLVESENPKDLIDPEVDGLYSRFINHKKSLWLVVDYGPMQPCAARPVEKFLAERTYQIQSIDLTPTVRLVEYNLTPMSARPFTRPANVRFGENIELVGFDLAGDPLNGLDSLQAGDRIGASLVWRTNAVLEIDYTIAVFLIGVEGVPVGQQDRDVYDLFPPTSQWEISKEYLTNFGFILPSPLPPGVYQLWVAIYSWPTPERLERLLVVAPDGSDLGDYYSLAEITIE